MRRLLVKAVRKNAPPRPTRYPNAKQRACADRDKLKNVFKVGLERSGKTSEHERVGHV